jgi:hypothetical protein
MVKSKGQNIAEYSILIALVIAAAVAMNTYVKRGLQARVHDAVKYVGTGKTVGDSALTFSGDQYEPYYVDSNANQTSFKKSVDTLENNGVVKRNDINETSRVETGGMDTVLAPTAANVD